MPGLVLLWASESMATKLVDSFIGDAEPVADIVLCRAVLFDGFTRGGVDVGAIQDVEGVDLGHIQIAGLLWLFSARSSLSCSVRYTTPPFQAVGALVGWS